jgi:hypothetical protein
MTVDDDKTTSDNIKVPKFDHSNKTVSRDARIKDYVQSFKCAVLAKYGMKGMKGLSFCPLRSRKLAGPFVTAFCEEKQDRQGCSYLLQDGARR